MPRISLSTDIDQLDRNTKPGHLNPWRGRYAASVTRKVSPVMLSGASGLAPSLISISMAGSLAAKAPNVHAALVFSERMCQRPHPDIIHPRQARRSMEQPLQCCRSGKWSSEPVLVSASFHHHRSEHFIAPSSLSSLASSCSDLRYRVLRQMVRWMTGPAAPTRGSARLAPPTPITTART